MGTDQTTISQSDKKPTPVAEESTQSEGVALAPPSQSTDAPPADNPDKSGGTKEGFVWDIGDMRKAPEVEKIKEDYKDQPQKVEEIVKAGKTGWTRWFSGFIVDGKVDPKGIGFMIPVKVYTSKTAGENWVQIEINTAYYSETSSKTTELVKRHPADSRIGYFDKRKIRQSNIDLNGEKELYDGGAITDTIDKVPLGSLGRFAIRNSRYIRNKINDKIDNEDHFSETEADKDSPLPKEKQETEVKDEDTNSLVGEVKKWATDKFDIFKGVSVGLGDVHLTGVGLFVDFKLRIPVKDQNPELTASFRLATNDNYAITYLGGQITDFPRLEFGNDNISLNLALNHIIHDPQSEGGAEISTNDGSISIKFFDQEGELTWNKIAYNTQDKKFHADFKKFNATIKIPFGDEVKTFKVVVDGPKISKEDGKFSYNSASGSVDKFTLLDKVDFVNTTITVDKEKDTVKASSTIETKNLTDVGIPVTSGKADISIESGKTKSEVEVQNGQFSVALYGQSLSLNQLSYKNKELKAGIAKIKLDILDQKLNADVINARINKDGFSFDTITAGLDDVSFGGVVKLEEIKANIAKSDEGYDVTGSGKISAIPGGIAGAEIKEINGGVKLNKTAKGISPEITEGNAKIAAYGQTFDLKNLEYKNKELTAQSASVDLDVLGTKANIQVNGAKFNDSGFSFDTITTKIDNLTFGSVAEIQNINVTLAKKSTGIDVTGSGKFAITNLGVPEAVIKKAQGNLQLQKEAGKVGGKMTEGELDISFLGQELKFEDLAYSSDTGIITATKAYAKVDVMDVKADIDIQGFKFDKAGFSFTTITIDIPEITIGGVASLKNIKVFLTKTSSNIDISGSGSFNVSSSGIPGVSIVEFSGNLDFEKKGEKIEANLKNGNVKIDFLGQKLNINGLEYIHATKELSATKAKADFDVYGKKTSVTILGAKINEEGFKFDRITADLPDMDFGSAKFKNVVINLTQNGKQIDLDGSGKFGLENLGIPGANLEYANGNVTFVKKNNKIKGALSNGNAKINIAGQSLTLSQVSYNSDNDKFSALNTNIALDVFGEKFNADIKDLTISKEEGINFAEFKLDINKDLDFGFVKVQGKDLVVKKNEDGGYLIKASGGVVLNVIPGMSTSFEGNGTLEYDTTKKSPKLDLEKARAEVANPLAFKFPGDFLPGVPWPINVDFGIPVFPGLEVLIGFYLKGEVAFADKIIIALTKTGDGVYKLRISTNVDGSVEAGVKAGIQAGNAFIASLSIALMAGGEIALKTELAYARSIGLGTEIPESEKLNGNNFFYNIDAELNLKAYLEIRGRLFYFLSKAYTKELASYNIGKYNFTNEKSGEKVEPTTNNILPSENEVKNEIVEPSPEYAGKSLKDLEGIEQSKRFASADVDSINSLYSAKASEDNSDMISVLSSFNRFMYNRIKWSDFTEKYLDKAKYAPDKKFISNSGGGDDELVTMFGDFGTAIHSKAAFVETYDKFIDKVEKMPVDDSIRPKRNQIVQEHKDLSSFYSSANELKGKVHGVSDGFAQFWSRRTSKDETQGLYDKVHTAYNKDKTKSSLASISTQTEKDDLFLLELIQAKRKKAEEESQGETAPTGVT